MSYDQVDDGRDEADVTQAPSQSTDSPLPVCDYTTDDDAPCEDPAVERRWSGASVITAAALGAIMGGILVAVGLVWSLGLLPGAQPLRQSSGSAGTQTTSQRVTINSSNKSVDIAEAVATKVVPSVVNVTIQATGVDISGRTVTQDQGNGSGVIIRSNGYILTNNHVVEGADRIVVRVGTKDMPAKVVGTDPSTDLAVIKIDGGGYPAIEVGESQSLKVGQFVMAVGSPFGLEKTVTSGIVSALQRSELVQGYNDITTYTNLIQTDAAINPGNSGGALVDESGKLVGINALIQTGSGSTSAQSAGIGFAIPVDFAIDIADQLIKTGKATHPYMGVSTETIDSNYAAQLNLKVQSGALVRFVQTSSPAEKAGIKSGDVIVKIGDREIASVEDVFAAIREHKIGETIPVDVVRNDTTLTLQVTLGSDADRK